MIRVLHDYGGANTRERRIEPGDYASDDPALFGLAEYLVENNHAIVIGDSNLVLTGNNGVVATISLRPQDADGDRDEEDAKANSLAQLEAAAALLEGKTPDVPLGERALLEATGHPVAKPDPKPQSRKRK